MLYTWAVQLAGTETLLQPPERHSALNRRRNIVVVELGRRVLPPSVVQIEGSPRGIKTRHVESHERQRPQVADLQRNSAVTSVLKWTTRESTNGLLWFLLGSLGYSEAMQLTCSYIYN